MLDAYEHITCWVEHSERESSDDELVIGVSGDEVGGDDGEGVDDGDHEDSGPDEFVVGLGEGGISENLTGEFRRIWVYVWTPLSPLLKGGSAVLFDFSEGSEGDDVDSKVY